MSNCRIDMYDSTAFYIDPRCRCDSTFPIVNHEDTSIYSKNNNEVSRCRNKASYPGTSCFVSPLNTKKCFTLGKYISQIRDFIWFENLGGMSLQLFRPFHQKLLYFLYIFCIQFWLVPWIFAILDYNIRKLISLHKKRLLLRKLSPA